MEASHRGRDVEIRSRPARARYAKSRDFGRRVRQWRLMADVANDAGLAIQMVAPVWRNGDHFLLLACVAAACHCACGVCAGATKASISQHFATDNFAELVAKEGSQETFVRAAARDDFGGAPAGRPYPKGSIAAPPRVQTLIVRWAGSRRRRGRRR